jgi:hypothetical protein
MERISYSVRVNALARIGLASVVVILLAGEAEARAPEARTALGAELRNGDWLAVEPVGLVLLAGSDEGANVAAMVRVVLGVGGSGMGIGLATGLGGPCIKPEPCELRDSLFSSIIGVEARAEHMYGPTGWRRATYVGPHLSFGGIFLKGSVGWMFDVHDRADNHFQIGVGSGW